MVENNIGIHDLEQNPGLVVDLMANYAKKEKSRDKNSSSSGRVIVSKLYRNFEIWSKIYTFYFWVVYIMFIFFLFELFCSEDMHTLVLYWLPWLSRGLKYYCLLIISLMRKILILINSANLTSFKAVFNGLNV